MATLANLVVNLRADNSRFNANIKSADTATNAFRGSLAKLGTAMVGVFSARAVISGVRDVIESFAIQERAVTELNASLQATGRFSQEASQAIRQSAAEIQQLTTHGDEAVISATSSLAQLANQLDTSDLVAVQRAIVGISDTFLQGNIEAGALLIGKTLSSSTNALSRYGIEVDTAASQQEKLNQILRQSETFFAVSQAGAETVGGRLEQLGNAWGDLKEAIGGVIADRTHLEEFMQRLTGVVGGLAIAITTDADNFKRSFQLVGIIAANAFSAAFLSTAPDVISAGLQRFVDMVTSIPVFGRLAALSPGTKIAEALIGALDNVDASEALANIQGAFLELEEMAQAAQAAIEGVGNALGNTPTIITPEYTLDFSEGNPGQRFVELMEEQRAKMKVPPIFVPVELKGHEKIADDAKRVADDYQVIWDQALRNVQDSFARTFSDIFDHGIKDIQGLADRILQIMKNLAAQLLAARLFEGITSLLPGGAHPGGGLIPAAGAAGATGGPGVGAVGGDLGFVPSDTTTGLFPSSMASPVASPVLQISAPEIPDLRVPDIPALVAMFGEPPVLRAPEIPPLGVTNIPDLAVTFGNPPALRFPSPPELPGIRVPDLPDIGVGKIPDLGISTLPELTIAVPSIPGLTAPDFPELRVSGFPELVAMFGEPPTLVPPELPEIKAPDFPALRMERLKELRMQLLPPELPALKSPDFPILGVEELEDLQLLPPKLPEIKTPDFPALSVERLKDLRMHLLPPDLPALEAPDFPVLRVEQLKELRAQLLPPELPEIKAPDFPTLGIEKLKDLRLLPPEIPSLQSPDLPDLRVEQLKELRAQLLPPEIPDIRAPDLGRFEVATSPAARTVVERPAAEQHVHVHFTVNAIDAPGVQRFIEDNRGLIASEVARARADAGMRP